MRRRRRRERPGLADEAAPSKAPSPLDALLAHEREVLVRRALARVPPRYREALVLFYGAGQSVSSVAAALGVSPETARQRLSRGRRHLREHVDLVEREVARARPGAGFVAGVVAALGAASAARGAPAAAAATGTRALGALMPAAALCGALAIWPADEPAHRTPAPVSLVAQPLAIPAPSAAPSVAAVAPTAAAPRPVVGARTNAQAPRPTAHAPRPTRSLRRRSAPPTAHASAPPTAHSPATARPAALATADEAASASRSSTLDRALAFYRRRDYLSASIELHKVVTGETADAPGDRQLAELYLGKSLAHMGLPNAALARFEAIVRHGPSHRHHRAVLPHLAALARALPEPSVIAPLVAAYPTDALDAPALDGARSEFHYLIGRHHYRDADPRRALAQLGAVADGSPRYLQARLLAGVLHVRARQARPATRAFAEVLAVAADPVRRRGYAPDELDRSVEVALLNLGRLHYSTGHHEQAIDAFARVSRRAPSWPTSIFEASWAYYRDGDHARALGHALTLEAPYFEDAFFPEALKVEAIVYFERCHYGRAERVVESFEERYGPVIRLLARAADRHADDDAFFRFARSLRRRIPPDRADRLRPAVLGGRARAAAPAETAARWAATALRDEEIERRFVHVVQLDAELARLEATDPSWKGTAVAAATLEQLTVERSLAEADAGRLARARLRRLVEELTELRADMRRIQIELLNLQAAHQGRPWPESELTIYAIDGHQRFWPFRGDFWRDELGRYYVELAYLCR